jgi:hypothetical protein
VLRDHRFARFLLIAALVGACAAPAAIPSAAGTEVSATEPASGGPAPSVAAPPTAEGTPVPDVTPEPSSIVAAFTFVPAGEPPDRLATRASAARDDIRITVELESAPLRVGVQQAVTVTVKNEGNRDARWLTDGCGSPIDIVGRVMGENWVGGAQQTGIKAEFKSEAIEAFGHAGYSPLGVDFTDPRIPPDAGCADVGIGKTIAAGDSIRTVLQWSGEPVVAPDGPIEIAASFRYYGHAGDQDDMRYDAIAVSLPSWIVSGYEPDFLPPGPAIDAALSDPAFAAWLAAAPSSTWINTSHTLDVDRHTWEIGLFRDGVGDFYGSVTMDSRTGQILTRRFE